MPPIYISGQEVVKRYVGIQEVVAAYVGAQQVFSSGVSLADVQALFGASDKGVVFDFTDTSAVFQNSNGTGAVSTINDPIGYVSDLSGNNKQAIQATAGSRPLLFGVPRSYGSELVANGRFTADADWAKGTGWTIAGGAATKTAGTASVISQSVALSAGSVYAVHVQVSRSAGTLTARLAGGSNVNCLPVVSNGSFYSFLLAVTGNNTLEFSADASFAGTIKNVSVKQVTAWSNNAAFGRVTESMRTAAIDMSASSKVTIIYAYRAGPDQNIKRPIWTDTPGSTAGSFDVRLPTYGAYLRTGGADQSVTTSEGKAHRAGIYYNGLDCIEIDQTQSVPTNAIKLRTAGALSSGQSGSGTVTNTALANTTLALLVNPQATVELFAGLGLSKVFVINRALSDAERVIAEAWCSEGSVIAAIVGDSTATFTSASDGNWAQPIDGLVGGIITGEARIATIGDKIADQKTKWNAIADKTRLECIFVQVGVNDCNSYGGTKTAAQVIADYQDLIATINSTKPATAKVYVSQMSPARGWLGVSLGTQAASYALWQALNEAIAGSGSTPITGVNGRITSHVLQLDAGSGYLSQDYDLGDGVHYTSEGRMIVAQAWRAQLEADGLV